MVDILQGDVRQTLPTLPEKHFAVCCTSPPYWALRSYATGDHKHLELGSEPTPAEYIANLVGVFDGVRRVMRDDGIVAVNLGDTYSGVANLGDSMQSLIEQNVIFLGGDTALAVAAKGEDVLFGDEFLPDEKFPHLLRVQSVLLKQRDEYLGKIIHAIGFVNVLVSGRAWAFSRYDDANLELIVDVSDGVNIVIPKCKLNAKASFKLSPSVGAISRKRDKTTLSVEQTAEPIAERIGNAEAGGDPVSRDTLTEGGLKIDPMNGPISLGNRFDPAADHLGDLAVTKSLQEKATFSACGGRVIVRADVVGHVGFLSDGCLIPYPSLYGKAIANSGRMMIPERFAMAMKERGWMLRDVIVWAKPSPMPQSINGTRFEKCRVKVGRGGDTKNAYQASVVPESHGSDPFKTVTWSDCPGCEKCRDNSGYVLRRGSGRTCTAHEYIYLFTKGMNYFFDMQGILEDCEESSLARLAQDVEGQEGSYRVPGKINGPMKAVGTAGGKRIPRSVQRWSAEPLSIGHYAAYPTAMPEFFIRAGTSRKGCCPTCGAAWARVVENNPSSSRQSGNEWQEGRSIAGHHGESRPGSFVDADSRTIGYRPTCSCPDAPPVPCRVLDPFGGTGSTAIAAMRLGCECTLLELSEKYVELARERIGGVMPLFALERNLP